MLSACYLPISHRLRFFGTAFVFFYSIKQRSCDFHEWRGRPARDLCF